MPIPGDKGSGSTSKIKKKKTSSASEIRSELLDSVIKDTRRDFESEMLREKERVHGSK